MITFDSRRSKLEEAKAKCIYIGTIQWHKSGFPLQALHITGNYANNAHLSLIACFQEGL